MDIAQRMGKRFSGPLVFYYVWWVLQESQKRGIHTLYFLARDGYVLYEAAKIFCKKFKLPISCKYLYCSRASVRMPTYFFIGEESFDLLFLWGYRVTLKSLLSRGNLTIEERQAIYTSCGLEGINEEEILSKKQFAVLQNTLRTNSDFRELIMQKSKDSYGQTIGYFRREGLFDEPVVALVDSGWTGSMQRSIRQLLESAGYQGRLIGFYFGMYATPKSSKDGEYFTWYFNRDGRTKDKALFCNNLFETILSAPHGMTVTYQGLEDNYEPVLNPAPKGKEIFLIDEQIESILSYIQDQVQKIQFVEFSEKALKRKTRKCIRRYMFLPKREEAEYYGQFLFCDDVTDDNRAALASNAQSALLKDYNIVRRVFRRLRRRPMMSQGQGELFWPYGTIAFTTVWRRVWYRVNIYLWEWMKYTIKRKSKESLL